jgi:hypothetical protein
MEDLKWETLEDTENFRTDRMKIVGGWLYRTIYHGRGIAICFA